MKIASESSDRQFLEALHRRGGGTIQEICEEAGVTATAVRLRLSRLQGMGLVSRNLARRGRGRPHHIYQVTPAGQRELGDNYADLAIILWREMKNIQEQDVRDRLVGRIRDALVTHYGRTVGGRSLEERVEQLKDSLVGNGFDVEVDASGALPILRENNCPYLELASHDASICELEQEVFQRILGTELSLSQCCLEGHRCCEFQPARPEGATVD